MSEKISFEEAIIKLEDRVKKLEGGNMSLDAALEAFEEAVGLVRLCNDKLEKAEARVRILTENADGSISDAPFDLQINEN